MTKHAKHYEPRCITIHFRGGPPPLGMPLKSSKNKMVGTEGGDMVYVLKHTYPSHRMEDIPI